MGFLAQMLRGNAHALNYALLLVAGVAPVVWYSVSRAPSSTDVEHILHQAYSADMQRSRRLTEDVGSFWRNKRTSREMDDVYADLLRSGAGAAKRHYHVEGALAQAEDIADPKAARLRAVLLQQPPQSGLPADKPSDATGAQRT